MAKDKWEGGSVNPADEEWDKPDKYYPDEGRKVFAPVGFERWDSKKGLGLISVRCVCLLDLEPDEPKEGEEEEPSEDAGLDADIMWFVSRRGIKQIVRFCRAVDFVEEFDPTSDDDIGSILADENGPVMFIATVAHDTYQDNDGKDRTNAKLTHFEQYEGDVEADFDELIREGFERHEEYMEWRGENPRGQKRSDDSGGDGGDGKKRGRGRGRKGGKGGDKTDPKYGF